MDKLFEMNALKKHLKICNHASNQMLIIEFNVKIRIVCASVINHRSSVSSESYRKKGIMVTGIIAYNHIVLYVYPLNCT